jgi:hypothetical protein
MELQPPGHCHFSLIFFPNPAFVSLPPLPRAAPASAATLSMRLQNCLPPSSVSIRERYERDGQGTGISIATIPWIVGRRGSGNEHLKWYKSASCRRNCGSCRFFDFSAISVSSVLGEIFGFWTISWVGLWEIQGSICWILTARRCSRVLLFDRPNSKFSGNNFSFSRQWTPL